VLSFDKDDEDALDFVAAAANLRSIVFSIESRSKFDIKQMAGNIIPAIATTNAMTAGLCVLQAFKILRGDLKRAKTVFLERGTLRVLSSEPPRPPNPRCTVCSLATTQLLLDSSRATLGDLVNDILRLKLGYSEELTVRHESTVLYDPDFDDNLGKTFAELNIGADNFLTVVDDEDESPRVDLSLTIVDK
jgi:ubiquitin-like 1-activating enzyme E1 B